MPAFLVETADDPVSRVDGSDMAVVFAATAADAKAMAQAKFSGDGNASWGAATVTEVIADPDLEGWRLRVRVAAPAGGPNVLDETYTGIASDAIDDMGAGIEALIDATGLTALYTDATQVLIVATGSGTDDLGDHTMLVEMLPPLALSAEPVAVPGFVTAQSDEGTDTDDLDCTFSADAYVVPNLVATGKQA